MFNQFLRNRLRKFLQEIFLFENLFTAILYEIFVSEMFFYKNLPRISTLKMNLITLGLIFFSPFLGFL